MKSREETELTIQLKEIPEEGRQWNFSKENTRLAEVLSDVLENNPFEIEFAITPMGNAFNIEGAFNSKIDLTCSRCGQDASHGISEKFQEILLIEEEPKGHPSQHQANSAADEGPFCNFVPSGELNVSEYVHELFASAEPYQVYCGRKNCEEEAAKYRSEDGFKGSSRENPFSALKSLITDKKTNKH